MALLSVVDVAVVAVCCWLYVSLLLCMSMCVLCVFVGGGACVYLCVLLIVC